MTRLHGRLFVLADLAAYFLNAGKQPTEKKLDIIRHASVPVMVVP